MNANRPNTMYGPLYNLFFALPLFIVVFLFAALPLLQWLSVRLFHREFRLRFSVNWSESNKEHRMDVVFSTLCCLLALVVTFLILELLILKGLLPGGQ